MRTTAETELFCVIYLRVSTEDQARKGYSLPQQRELCLEKARELAMRESVAPAALTTAEFEDTLGGDLLDRPVLEQVREMVRSRRPRYFICLDPDRFSRELFTQLLVTREIESAGTELVFVQHQYSRTAEGKLFYSLRGAIAEFEKAKILERTARGARGKLRQGKLPHGVPTYGYRYDKEADTLAVTPGEARWVQQIFAWAAEGLSPSAICSRLNALGVPAKKGGVWYGSTVRGMLRNTAYIGEMLCNRYDWTGLTAQMQLPKARRRVKLTARVRPASEWIAIAVPCIVEPDLFRRVQAVMAGSKRRAQRGVGLLSGLVRCGLCGGAVHYVKGRAGHHNLRCSNRYSRIRQREEATPPPACRLPHLRAALAEQAVWRQVEAWLVNPEELGRRRPAPTSPAVSARDRLALLQERLTAARREQGVTLGLLNQGVLDEAVAQESLRAAKQRIEAVLPELRLTTAEVARLEHAPPADPECAPDEAIPALAAKVRAVLAALDPERRRYMVRLLVREVILYPERRVETLPQDLA